MPLSQVGTALKKLMPKYRIKRYGCKTLGELYEQFDWYELVKTEKGVAGDGEENEFVKKYLRQIWKNKQKESYCFT